MPVTNLNDEWFWRLNVAMLECAINRGDIEKALHEDMLWGSKPIPNAPQTVVVPASLLAPHKTSRKAFAKIVKTARCTTVEGLKKTFLKHKTALVKMNRAVVLDYVFMEENCEALINQQIHDDILALMPTAAAERPTMAQVTMKLASMRASKRLLE